VSTQVLAEVLAEYSSSKLLVLHSPNHHYILKLVHGLSGIFVPGYRILHIRWYDHITNDEVLRRTGLLAASSIIRKRRLGLFGHVARPADDVPANQILQTCCKAQHGHGNQWLTLSADRFGGKSQRRDATTDRFAPWWWWWLL